MARRSLPSTGSTFKQAAGINSANEAVGIYDDASNVEHGFTYLGGVYTTLDPPLSKSTTAVGINDNGVISGSYSDSSSVVHGFLYLNGVFNTVDVPGASGPALTHININNKNRFAGGLNHLPRLPVQSPDEHGGESTLHKLFKGCTRIQHLRPVSPISPMAESLTCRNYYGRRHSNPTLTAILRHLLFHNLRMNY